jgi:hypothetical protein
MADREPNGTEIAVQEHVRKILARLSALKVRLRAQEQAREGRSGDAVEVDREDDRAGGVRDDPPP